LKVVHISSSDLAGGASIACKRINDSLILKGIDSNLLVQKKSSSDKSVQSTSINFLDDLRYKLRFILDEGYIRLFTNSERGRFSNPFFGTNILRHPLTINSDIINLHWINGGFVSLKLLEKIGKTGKPIVWTLHDMWAFTGGCHYSLDCKKFESECRFCPCLKIPGEHDFSKKIFHAKKFLKELNLTIVTCSKWLKQEAETSELLKSKRIINIPNPLDTELYKPLDRKVARSELGLNEDKFYILFGAMNTVDERKGLKYLLRALQKLYGEISSGKENIEVIVFGKSNEKIISSIPFNCKYFGRFKNEDEIIACYNSADVFMAPSLQDNLPNTVLESLSCGTPVVAFSVGGMPDMIDHLENGYLASPDSVEDLANGIKWYVNNQDKYKEHIINARTKVIKNFNQDIIAARYIELYSKLLEN
jgi:glycosyltransferase involved in cell wall biosynthesis